MLRSGLKLLIVLLVVFTLYKCIDPFYPKLGSYDPLLVVEGLITNDNRVYFIKLSYSTQDRDSATEKISDAVVYVSDESGKTAYLISSGDGIYKTDSVTFRGETGKTYQLHIKTGDGKVYESDSCEMMPVPLIDTIYFGKDEKMTDNQTITRQGVSIFLDSRPIPERNIFLRWDFEETWKFKVPYPTFYKYVNEDTIIPLSPFEINEFCYKNSKSTNIVIMDDQKGISDFIKQVPVQFISPEESDRLTIRYSIYINQYSISQKEFKFWESLKKMNETEGDIFGSQPFSVLSNIRNVSDPYERVLGYFQVSAVTHKRKFIDFGEIIPLGVPLYYHNCVRIAKSPRDYQTPWSPPVTFDDVYNMFMVTSRGYSFVEPVYSQQSTELLQLVFTHPQCADCRVTGTLKRPDFWTD